jgi:hypothetical protein
MAISSKAISPKAIDLAARPWPRRADLSMVKPAAVADGEGGSEIVGQGSGCQQDGAGAILGGHCQHAGPALDASSSQDLKTPSAY